MNTERRQVTIDGNEAVAHIAYRCSEVIAIYPITPASPMGEHADAWASQELANLFGDVPRVVEMQSEAGAAGVIHGAIQTGALATTFTASQGLLLMIPNLYRIAGELTPLVIHVAARAVAAQALSIFCDHSDVMSTRATGFALLASSSVQEAHDLALAAHVTSLNSRIPVLHFFDGFRTSHEVSSIALIPDEQIRAMLSDDAIAAHRERALNPEHPVMRGSAQNPDVFFQGRETVNHYYQAFPMHLESALAQLATLTGRAYHLFDYTGAPDAERIVVLMGSAAQTAEETVEDLVRQGEAVGVLKVRLYRPFSAVHFLQALPGTVKAIAVLDRTKEPGADGEPLYKDVVTALFQAAASGQWPRALPKVVGGRYGLGSKEMTPGMVAAVLAELARPEPRNGFTIGIEDDLSNTSLRWDEHYRTQDASGGVSCVFYGLGADGTVSANKNSIRIIGEETGLQAQGYFVYDSKKSGAVTVSHLRFGEKPIRSSYLIQPDMAHFVACHQPGLLEKYDVLQMAAPGAVFLLNTQVPVETIWASLPETVAREIIRKQLQFHVIDAQAVAQQSGLGKRINTVMQACFFALSEVLPTDRAMALIKDAVTHTYGAKGTHLVRMNFLAIDNALAGLRRVSLPESLPERPSVALITSELEAAGPAPGCNALQHFAETVTPKLIAGLGDRIPVSQMPVDGTFPTGTAALEKRNLALEIPQWEPDLCTHCGKCVFVCPHSAIRSKAFPESALAGAPESFFDVPIKGKD
jgi:pyruvate-ferredoxin/flavodoxin oxidoreductase